MLRKKTKIFPDMESAEAVLKKAPIGLKLGLACMRQGWVINVTNVGCSTEEYENWENLITETKDERLDTINTHSSREKRIPDYEEGTLRSEWGTREDHKKMRARDWGDMQRRRKE